MEGEHVGDDGIEGPVYHDGNLVTLVTIDFLESIYAQRQQVIRSLLNVWPPQAHFPGAYLFISDKDEYFIITL